MHDSSKKDGNHCFYCGQKGHGASKCTGISGITKSVLSKDSSGNFTSDPSKHIPPLKKPKGSSVTTNSDIDKLIEEKVKARLSQIKSEEQSKLSELPRNAKADISPHPEIASATIPSQPPLFPQTPKV